MNIQHQEENGRGAQITAGSWGLNDSIKLKKEAGKNSFTFKLKQKMRLQNKLMTSFEKKVISFRIRRAAARRSTKTLPRQTLEKHVSIKSFYSEETDEQKEARREKLSRMF